MLIAFFRAIFLYALITFSLRLMGKRQLGELQPAELVITILISNIASLPIEDTNIPLIIGIIPVLVLVGFEIIISNVSLKSKRFRGFISGKPIIIIRDGMIQQKALRMLRFSIDDLMEGIRQAGFFDIEEVEYAIVETTGKLSIMPKFNSQPVTTKMLDIKGFEKDPPIVIISDGEVLYSALEAYNLSKKWLDNILKIENYTEKEVFIMTSDRNKNYYIVKKEAKNKRRKNV